MYQQTFQCATDSRRLSQEVVDSPTAAIACMAFAVQIMCMLSGTFPLDSLSCKIKLCYWKTTDSILLSWTSTLI